MPRSDNRVANPYMTDKDVANPYITDKDMPRSGDRQGHAGIRW